MEATHIHSRYIDRAITVFHVNPEWYERYWFGQASSESVDFDLHRHRAAHERALARQHVYQLLLTLTKRGIRHFVFLLASREIQAAHKTTKASRRRRS